MNQPTNLPDLDPDGPCDPQRTAALGRLLDEATRALAHTTMHDAAIEYASEVYRLLGDLYTAIGRLPQICGQLDAWMHAAHEKGLLREVSTGRHGGDTHRAVAELCSHLATAGTSAGQLTRHLQGAQNAIGGVEHAEADLPHRPAVAR